MHCGSMSVNGYNMSNGGIIRTIWDPIGTYTGTGTVGGTGAFTFGAVHHMKLDIDMINNTYNLYIDNTLIKAVSRDTSGDLPAGSIFGSISFSTSSTGYGTIAFNNFRMYINPTGTTIIIK